MTTERDLRNQMAYARKEAIAEGLAEGRAEGRAQGLAEGRAEGRAEGLAEAVKKMIAAGIEREAVADIMGLSLAEVDVMLK